MATATSMPVQANQIIANSTLTQVLQSDPVRRLFNQPNIVIHAIPRTDSPTAFRMVRPKSIDNRNEINGENQLSNDSEMNIQVLNSSSKDSNEENFLPSKNNGKSEILLVPITRKRKECGHFEPCESLVSNADVKQYEDEDGVTPLISVNISEDEIDTLVTKHCFYERCDALSIDYDRCRRASICLNRCDKCIICDICGIKFETLKDHLDHKKCKRKQVYQHNIATPTEIFKCRMRERELQILEAARSKRSADYLDPVLGFSRTMEALSKNDELIIIPKLPPPQSKVLIPTFTPVNNKYNNSIYNNSNNSNIKNILGNKKTQSSDTDRELTSEMISNIILSCKNSIEMANRNARNNSIAPKQIKLSDHLNGATVKIMDSYHSQKQQMKVAALPPNINSPSVNQLSQTNNTEMPLSNHNINSSQKQKIADIKASSTNSNTGAKALKKSKNVKNLVLPNQEYVTPFKVVPIAEFKSQPSLLHKSQGAPKFCVVPDTAAIPPLLPIPKKLNSKETEIRKEKPKTLLIKSITKLPNLLPKPSQIFNSSKFRPLLPAVSGTTRNVDVKLGSVIMRKKQKMRKRARKKMLKKGKFKCTYCPKRFSSIDYCKIHIAKHEDNPGFFCRLCEKGFLNKYIMKKHMDADHKTGEVRCEMCNAVLPSMQDLIKHMKFPETKINQPCSECSESFDTCSSLDFHMRKEHGYLICTLCKRQVAKIKMKRHIMLEHSFSKNRSETGLDRLTCPPGENDVVTEIDIISEETVKDEGIVIKSEPVNDSKIQPDCLARNRSIRRRSSKELFVCSVCDRRFENEKQFQIHLANNPMKFTLCPDCGRKFHRKSEYTEHSKTCSKNPSIKVEQTPKRRKSNLPNEEPILKIGNDIKSQNSIDQTQNKTLDSNLKCKKLKLNEEKIVQKEDKNVEGILKITVETKLVNGLKQNSSDCLNVLKIVKKENIVSKNEKLEVKNHNNEDVSTKVNTNESIVFDKAAVISSIFQDHNYQALQ